MFTPFRAVDLNAEVVTRYAGLAIVGWSAWPYPDSYPDILSCMGLEEFDKLAKLQTTCMPFLRNMHTLACSRCLLLTCCLLMHSTFCLTGFLNSLYPLPDSSRSYPYECLQSPSQG